MNHDDILELIADQPAIDAQPGDILIDEGEPTDGVLILREGTLEIRRAGQLVAIVEQPGSMVGEMAMLLDSPSTADVVARGPVNYSLITDPEAFFAAHPKLALFLARILAQRLHSVTGYLSELKDTYGDSEDHLGLAAAVVDQLLASRGTSIGDLDVDEPTDEEIEEAARDL